MVGTIQTSRQDIYVRLVKNAKRDRGDDEEEGKSDYLFDYQYELFSFAAIKGFLTNSKIDPPDNWSQDIVKVSNISDGDHVNSIKFITKLVELEEDVEEDEAWDHVLRYADAGLEDIADDLDTQEEFDLVRFVQEADGQTWRSRLIEAVGDPDEVGAGL